MRRPDFTRADRAAFIRDAIFRGKAPYLSNGSGGTDICGPFVSSVPTRPIRVGEIQSSVLGMAIEAWNDNGQPVYGEQVSFELRPHLCCRDRAFARLSSGLASSLS